MAREIPLTQGQVAIVDDEDFERLNQHKWFAQWSPSIRSYYAARNIRVGINKQRPIFMHREVLGLTRRDRRLGEHKTSGATLDNRRSNLRIGTDRGNNGNTRIRKDNKSGFKGVVFHKCSGKWTAQLGRSKKGKLYLGLFIDKEQAARVYDRAALRYFGEFARLNFPREDYL